MGSGIKLSLVLPAFNEEENILPFHDAVASVLDDASGGDYEIIVVDDGSTDGTHAKLIELMARAPTVRVIRFSRNFGHQAALTAGLERARGDAIITMDCDFQDPPEVIPEMVAKWGDGHRVVYARRRTRGDKPFKKVSAAAYYTLLSRFSDVAIPQQVADFRLIDRVVLDNLLRLGEHARYLRGMVAWLGFEPAFVEFDRPERRHGATHYPLKKMLRFAMDGILSFSSKPLRVAFWVGLAAIMVSLVLFVTMVWVTLTTRLGYFPVYKWLVVILFGFMGGQFILLWIVGEYIGRIYSDVRSRPLYVIDEALNFDEEGVA